MVRRLPVAELVGRAEPGHAQRRGISDRAAEIMRRGAVANRVLERRYDRRRVVAEDRLRERGMVAPRPLAAPGGEQSGELVARPSSKATRSTGCRQAVVSSRPRAATIWPTTVGSTGPRARSRSDRGTRTPC